MQKADPITIISKRFKNSTMKKLIIKAAKLFFAPDAVLPILQDSAFIGDTIQWTDLEVSLIVPFKSGITGAIPTKLLVKGLEMMDNPQFKNLNKPGEYVQIEMTQGKERIVLAGDPLDNFPVIPNVKRQAIGSLPAEVIPILKGSILFQSHDDLRPAMTYTYVDGHIAATDAHRLMFVKLDEPLKEGIFVHSKVIKLMEIFGGDWMASLSTKENTTHLRLENSDGVVIVSSQPDCRFPDWKVVVPQVDAKTPCCTLNVKEIQKALKNGKTFANRSTNQGIFKLGKKSTYSTADIDFSISYETEIGVSVPKDHEIEVGFNSDFVDKILTLCGDTVKMNYWSPTKPFIFDGKYLCMPIMMNR
jgi:DNA polymerase III sliding clamp (beta) subunit (PCNA family)